MTIFTGAWWVCVPVQLALNTAQLDCDGLWAKGVTRTKVGEGKVDSGQLLSGECRVAVSSQVTGVGHGCWEEQSIISPLSP